jgi:hypothetical protein
MNTDDTLNYERLLYAIRGNKICIIDFIYNKTKETVPIICAIANDGKESAQQAVPLAILLQNNMNFWEEFSPVLKKTGKE